VYRVGHGEHHSHTTHSSAHATHALHTGEPALASCHVQPDLLLLLTAHFMSVENSSN
jgi:mRNA-degrading endonuclease YafQ of YafQ-DinJ toxin-antitoxin module